MYRYKLMFKQNWLLILMVILGVLSVIIWIDNMAWIARQVSEV
jgi:cytoskeletal protein RodZ